MTELKTKELLNLRLLKLINSTHFNAKYTSICFFIHNRLLQKQTQKNSINPLLTSIIHKYLDHFTESLFYSILLVHLAFHVLTIVNFTD